MFLQSYIVPVCIFEQNGGQALIVRLAGSAFFIDDKGTFLTATHVLDDARAAADAAGHEVGLVVKRDSGKSRASAITRVIAHDAMAEPWDISCGKTNYKCETALRVLSDSERTAFQPTWKEVATLGYPLDAVSGPPTALNLNARGQRGHIQRELRPGDLLHPNPDAFEVSFLLSRGMSGAPLFYHSRPRDVVIGVCTGSFRTETIEDTITEINESGQEYKEIRTKIEQFGIAQDLRQALGWKPSFLEFPLGRLT